MKIIIIILLLLAQSVYCDDGVMQVTGGIVVPSKSDNIQMLKERVYITLLEDKCKVKCKFWFYNYSETETITVGFPFFWGYWHDYYYEGELDNFNTRVDGLNYQVTKIAYKDKSKINYDDPNYAFRSGHGFYYWDVTFPAYDTIIIENSYDGEWESMLEGSRKDFNYIIGTGSTWSGPIKDGVIIFDYSKIWMLEYLCDISEDFNSKNQGIYFKIFDKKIIYQLINYIPYFSYNYASHNYNMEDIGININNFVSGNTTLKLKQEDLLNLMNNLNYDPRTYGPQKPELENMKRYRKLIQLKNEILARNGYVFNETVINTYFQNFEWYKPNMDFTSNQINNEFREILSKINNSIKEFSEYYKINSEMKKYYIQRIDDNVNQLIEDCKNEIFKNPIVLKGKKPEIQSKVFLVKEVLSFSNRHSKFRDSYSYNENGNVLLYLEERWENGQWLNDMRRSYTYDSNGDRLSRLCERWENGQWLNWYRVKSAYDSNEKRISDLMERWENEQWVNSGRETYTYDTRGNKLSYLEEDWKNGQWVNKSHRSYTYDLNGNLLSYLEEDWKNGQWVNDRRDSYTYDSNGNKLSKLCERWDNGQLVYRNQSTLKYDLNGNIISSLDKRWDNGQLIHKKKCTSSYDLNRNVVWVLMENWGNEQWVKYLRFIYDYDSNGNKLSCLNEIWHNGQWVNFSRRTNSYNSNGNWLLELTERWENKKWVNDWRKTYSYDSNGNLLSHLIERWYNEKWNYDNQFLHFTDSSGNNFSFSGCYKIEISWISINSRK